MKTAKLHTVENYDNATSDICCCSRHYTAAAPVTTTAVSVIALAESAPAPAPSVERQEAFNEISRKTITNADADADATANEQNNTFTTDGDTKNSTKDGGNTPSNNKRPAAQLLVPVLPAPSYRVNSNRNSNNHPLYYPPGMGPPVAPWYPAS